MFIIFNAALGQLQRMLFNVPKETINKLDFCATKMYLLLVNLISAFFNVLDIGSDFALLKTYLATVIKSF